MNDNRNEGALKLNSNSYKHCTFDAKEGKHKQTPVVFPQT